MTQKIETNSSFTLSKLNQSYSFNQEVDYRISGPTVSKVLDSEVIFVGYGFIDKENQYDDYKGIDVNGKIIVRLEGYPGHQDTNSAGYKLFHKDERYFEYYLDKEKDKIAREKGAIAIVEILFDNNSKYWIEKKEFHKMDYNESPYPPIYEHRLSLPSNTISNNLLKIYALKKIGNKIMENHGATLADFEKSVANNLKPNSRKLKNIRLKVNYNVKTELLHTRNILGVIEGEKKDEIIVVGGHYDHLGMKNGFIWNGADDNASGTVGVWTIAKAFIASGIKPKRTIVFAGWTAEEKGLMGSKYFVNHPYGEKIENIKFYLNLDMISKDNESDTLKNQARMTYTSNIENLEDITNKHLKEHELNLDLNYRSSAKPSGGSDHTPFSMKNIPIMYFDAGYPITYHTPKDETSDVNYEKMTNIIKLAYLNLWEIVNKE